MQRCKHGRFGVAPVSPSAPKEMESDSPENDKFSGLPNISEFPAGNGPQLVKGKLVAVVGLQKSSLDIAMEFSAANVHKSVKINAHWTIYDFEWIIHAECLYRTKHWNIPDYHPWGVPMAYLYNNHFADLSIHKPCEGFLLSLLATLLSAVMGIFKTHLFVETHLKRKLGLAKFGMVPGHNFLQELSSCLISTVPEDFYYRVEKGSIRLKKASSFSFSKRRHFG
ncbi:hypothetical protein Acr_07g0000120 [Actinidia rufa]|uniref:Flavin-containing monooxygenase n=1 Tax=Actinidia rufa TaxID=165716 RepID=A0A7J0ETI9_9ERIC|nr:hypothetical protein Acr_07g0000120 [Actinidia rufa]